ncbi:hypothetical protein SNEBB_004196, partial [Seison nebaliae]
CEDDAELTKEVEIDLDLTQDVDDDLDLTHDVDDDLEFTHDVDDDLDLRQDVDDDLDLTQETQLRIGIILNNNLIIEEVFEEELASQQGIPKAFLKIDFQATTMIPSDNNNLLKWMINYLNIHEHRSGTKIIFICVDMILQFISFRMKLLISAFRPCVLNSLVYIFYYRSVFSAPGQIRKGWKSYNEENKLKLKWCNHCNGFIPPRAYHCTKCKLCRPRFDHHCPAINNCVAILNFKEYFLFILFATINTSVGLYYVLMYWVYALEDEVPESIRVIFKLNNLLTIFECIGVILFTGNLLLWQFFTITINLTLTESLVVNSINDKIVKFNLWNLFKNVEKWKKLTAQSDYQLFHESIICHYENDNPFDLGLRTNVRQFLQPQILREWSKINKVQFGYDFPTKSNGDSSIISKNFLQNKIDRYKSACLLLCSSYHPKTLCPPTTTYYSWKDYFMSLLYGIYYGRKNIGHFCAGDFIFVFQSNKYWMKVEKLSDNFIKDYEPMRSLLFKNYNGTNTFKNEYKKQFDLKTLDEWSEFIQVQQRMTRGLSSEVTTEKIDEAKEWHRHTIIEGRPSSQPL